MDTCAFIFIKQMLTEDSFQVLCHHNQILVFSFSELFRVKLFPPQLVKRIRQLLEVLQYFIFVFRIHEGFGKVDFFGVINWDNFEEDIPWCKFERWVDWREVFFWNLCADPRDEFFEVVLLRLLVLDLCYLYIWGHLFHLTKNWIKWLSLWTHLLIKGCWEQTVLEKIK